MGSQRGRILWAKWLALKFAQGAPGWTVDLMSVDALFDGIDNYFLKADRLRKIEAFTHSQRQVEGWFKGELIWFLTGGANVWEAEVPFPHDRRKRCDFMVDVEGTPVYLELKALYHG